MGKKITYMADIFCKNPEDIDDVMKEVKNLDWIDWQYYELVKDDSMYKDAVKPLDTVKRSCLYVFVSY